MIHDTTQADQSFCCEYDLKSWSISLEMRKILQMLCFIACLSRVCELHLILNNYMHEQEHFDIMQYWILFCCDLFIHEACYYNLVNEDFRLSLVNRELNMSDWGLKT